MSAEDKANGFNEGVLGYDVPSNIAITLIGMLYGGEDFGKVQCIAVNCGEDTDCTAATAGSIWGIIHGAKEGAAKMDRSDRARHQDRLPEPGRARLLRRPASADRG